jgi:hypothetical protein
VKFCRTAPFQPNSSLVGQLHARTPAPAPPDAPGAAGRSRRHPIEVGAGQQVSFRAGRRVRLLGQQPVVVGGRAGAVAAQRVHRAPPGHRKQPCAHRRATDEPGRAAPDREQRVLQHLLGQQRVTDQTGQVRSRPEPCRPTSPRRPVSSPPATAVSSTRSRSAAGTPDPDPSPRSSPPLTAAVHARAHRRSPNHNSSVAFADLRITFRVALPRNLRRRLRRTGEVRGPRTLEGAR